MVENDRPTFHETDAYTAGQVAKELIAPGTDTPLNKRFTAVINDGIAAIEAAEEIVKDSDAAKFFNDDLGKDK